MKQIPQRLLLVRGGNSVVFDIIRGVVEVGLVVHLKRVERSFVLQRDEQMLVVVVGEVYEFFHRQFVFGERARFVYMKVFKRNFGFVFSVQIVERDEH